MGKGKSVGMGRQTLKQNEEITYAQIERYELQICIVPPCGFWGNRSSGQRHAGIPRYLPCAEPAGVREVLTGIPNRVFNVPCDSGRRYGACDNCT